MKNLMKAVLVLLCFARFQHQEQTVSFGYTKVSRPIAKFLYTQFLWIWMRSATSKKTFSNALTDTLVIVGKQKVCPVSSLMKLFDRKQFHNAKCFFGLMEQANGVASYTTDSTGNRATILLCRTNKASALLDMEVLSYIFL